MEAKSYDVVFLSNPRDINGVVHKYDEKNRDSSYFKDKIIAVKIMPLFPAYTTIPYVKAIILEESGYLSHVVIIAREFGKTVVRVPKGVMDKIIGKKISIKHKESKLYVVD